MLVKLGILFSLFNSGMCDQIATQLRRLRIAAVWKCICWEGLTCKSTPDLRPFYTKRFPESDICRSLSYSLLSISEFFGSFSVDLQAFYVIHGRGKSHTELGVVEWSTGDLFVIPSSKEEMPCIHTCFDDDEGNTGGAGLYWVSDAPLLSYLGVMPKVKKFEPTYFRWTPPSLNTDIMCTKRSCRKYTLLSFRGSLDISSFL